MIDARRSTKTERIVLTDALEFYRLKMVKTAARHPNHAKRSDAQWRAFECERLLAELDGR